MWGPVMRATYDRGRGDGPVELELGPVRDEKEAAQLFTEWVNDNRVRLFLSALRPCTVSAEEDWVRGVYANQDGVTWSIYANNALVGNIGIDDIDRIHRRGELGILIGDRRWWGRGIATASELLVVDYALRNIVADGLNKVYARVLIGNDGSRKALENVGFREIGVTRKDHWAFGRWWDLWHCELLREDWARIRQDRLKAAGVTSFDIYPGCEGCGV